MNIDNIDAFIFDFDGVLTNNKVYVSQNGHESVACCRSDGLAFDALNRLNKPTYILSTEENVVVSARANKLKIEAIQGVKDKASAINRLADQEGFKLERILYVGNDLNDYYAMKICGYTLCPSDSHSIIKEISDIVLESSGGSGVVRELLEEVLGLNLLKILFKK
jgi:3-deoxy-D-manno-octulosonate 8-phosphate phosphatase (KDO 8-P phosphatase)